MNRSILYLFILSILISFLPLNFALSYNYDANNGSWNEYVSGLSNSYYALDSTQATNNRGFEDSFSASSDSCQNHWCMIGTVNGTWVRSSTQANEGSYSLFLDTGNIGNADAGAYLVSASNEDAGDSNISFDYLNNGYDSAGQLLAGYMNDLNEFFVMQTISLHTVSSSWVHTSYLVPKGKFKIAFYINSGVMGSSNPYLDNIKITKNNAGTFRTTSPQYCNSILSCSDIIGKFPATQLGDLYWVIDYVAGATCTYTTTGGNSGSMIEGTQGMYYIKLNETVTSGFSKDVNLSATCNKIPFVEKSFFARATVFRYGALTNGEFDTNFSGTSASCTGDWCLSYGNHGGGATRIQFNKAISGLNILNLYSNSESNASTILWSKSNYEGGKTIQFAVQFHLWDASAQQFQWGYVDDSNSFTAVGGMVSPALSAFTNGVTDWNVIDYNIPSGLKRPAFAMAGVFGSSIDVFIDRVLSSGAKQTSTITATNNLVNNFGLRGNTYTFYSSYKNEASQSITGSICQLGINGVFYPMTYNSGTQQYSYSYGFITDGIYTIRNTCASTNYTDANATSTITIGTSLTKNLTITPIKNIGAQTLSDLNNLVTFTTQNSTDDIIFSAINQTNAYTFNAVWTNADTSKKAYFVYTSTDGINWTFDDTMTFGAGVLFNDGLQKVWNGSSYTYSVNVSLLANTLKYIKFAYQPVPLQWQTIKTSSDWVNINDPTAWNDSANHYYDTFQDSNYTNIQSYTAQNFQNLIGSGITAGYEIQFTAYATADTNLEVGSRTGTNDTTNTIAVTTTAQRFSVPINPSAWTSLLLFKSTNTIGQIVYISDYAIVPRSYFYGRLDITQNNGDPLQAILRDGNSNIYLREAVPFRVVTNSYDSSGTINKLRVQVLIGTIAIKTYDFNITPSAGQITNWNETLQGVIDLNGTAGAYNALSPLRDLTVQATLYNTSGNSVAQQYQTVKLLQYPYFPQDFSFSIDTTNKKLGKPASFSLNFTQLDPSYFIGFEFSIYDGNHTLALPNFQQTILANQLNCSSLYACSKSITFNEFVYPAETQYHVMVVGLFKTENKTYQNLLTIRGLQFPVSASAYETARVLQVFERRDANITPHSYYKPTETIPLVLQIRDDSYANLENEVKPYMKLRVNGSVLYNTTAFLPTKFIYDETTGYNYWYFNDLLIDDSGNLFETGDTIQPIVYLVSNTGGHTSVSADPITYSRKCVTYPSDFFNGSLLMNAIGFIGDATFGCTVDSNILVTASNSNQHLDMNQLYTPTSTITQSVLCLRADLNTAYKAQLGDDLLCVIAYTKSEEMIDGFKVRVGNDNSDYAVTDSTKQYLEFPISGEQVIFNDLGMIRNSLEAEYNTQNIHTYGQLIGAGFQHMLNYSGAQGIADFGSWLTDAGVVQNVGWDLNLSETFSPTSAHGLFFVRVSGLKVINQYDYVGKYPELQSISAKNFLSYMRSKGEKITVGNATAYVGNFGSSNAFNVITTASPLIIYETPAKSSSADANGVTTSTPTNLKFYFISDLLSNNGTRDYRAYVPIWFSYTVPTRFDVSGVVNDVLYGKDGFGNDAGLLTNPLGFGLKNWFWFLILVVLILAISLIARNFRSGGNTTNIINKK